MASYQPVAQNESSVAETLLADETFANDRDKSDAKSHHLELDRTGRHHLVSPQVSIKLPVGRQSTLIAQPTASAGQGSVGIINISNNGAGGGNNKPNVTFKDLPNDSSTDKVLSGDRLCAGQFLTNLLFCLFVFLL